MMVKPGVLHQIETLLFAQLMSSESVDTLTFCQ